MILGTKSTNKMKKYKYKGKIIECEESIIKQLNYALALINSQYRYVEIKDKENGGEE